MTELILAPILMLIFLSQSYVISAMADFVLLSYISFAENDDVSSIVEYRNVSLRIQNASCHTNIGTLFLH